MTLGQKQRQFMRVIPRLIDYAYSLGYELTLGDGYRDFRLHGEPGKPGGYGQPNSAHKVRLAIDLNLFQGGVYLHNGADAEKGHNMLHDFWDTLGGAERIKHDLNHYSFEHNGCR
jgi:hypothetical protein